MDPLCVINIIFCSRNSSRHNKWQYFFELIVNVWARRNYVQGTPGWLPIVEDGALITPSFAFARKTSRINLAMDKGDL